MPAGAERRRGGAARATFVAGLCLTALVCAGLGIWQVQRRSWKLDLIARTEERLRAAPVTAPGPADWPAISPQNDEYRRISLHGRYLDAAETLTMAVTERGPGFWVLAPFRADAGFTVLVNRGFVPEGQRAPEERRKAAAGKTKLTGLLRPSEPGGGFLRANAPAQGRWHSRDVAAMAETLGLGSIAPYFIDEDAPVPAVSERWPAAGLTVVQFRNHHLIYALTWFGLAGLAAYGLVRIWRDPAAASPDPG